MARPHHNSPESDADRSAHEGQHAHGQHHGHHNAEAVSKHAHAHMDHGAAVEPAAAHPDSHMGHVGHDPHDEHADHGVMHEGHAVMMRNRFLVTLPLTVIVLLFSPLIQQWFGFQIDFPGSQWVAPIVGSVIFFYGGLPFLSMARQELALRQPGMMTLISVAITTAYVYSLGIFFFPPPHTGDMSMTMMDFFWELATLITIMLLGHWIELRSVGQAQGALRELAKLLPDTAERIIANGETETVTVDQLRTGDRILIRPGASIPADGTVFDGDSSINESMLTGESRPVDKKPGDTVIGGSVNGAGSLRVEIRQVGEQTALAGIMRLVEEAQKSQSRAQTLAQRAAYYLTLIAIGAGILTLLGWLLFTGNLADAVRYTVGVLVVACPHALGLAVPLVIAISTTLSARNGLLVRQRIALEGAKDLNMVIFDKTGTLTKGEQGVVQVVASGIDETAALQIAAGIEGDSEHMIAQAIRNFAQERNVRPAPVTGFASIAGRGVKAQVDGKTYFVGGPRLLEQQGLGVPETMKEAIESAEAGGRSVIYLADEQRIVAMFVIADVIREESKAAVRELHDLGLKVAMLTGDSDAVARSVAQALEIDTYIAQVLPEHKADRVRQLQQGGNKVAMVGDGVNDAPALVTADVGIAIGAGTDVAIESAGIILVRSNPLDIVKIIRLSRATYRKMVQNLIWATGYNVVAIPLAMGVLAPIGITLDPAVGAIFMSLSTVIVAVNAQLLKGLNLNA